MVQAPQILLHIKMAMKGFENDMSCMSSNFPITNLDDSAGSKVIDMTEKRL
jgi:hypothetical protein